MTEKSVFDTMDLEAHRAKIAHEVEEAKHQRAMDLEQEKRRRERHETFRTAIVTSGVTLAVLGVIAAVTWAVIRPEGPDSKGQREERREQTCVANGGGWVPESLLATSNVGLCVYPGETVRSTSD